MKTAKLASVITLAALFLAGMAFAQTDPGVRGGAAGTGGPLGGLSADESAFFSAAKARFGEVDSVSGTIEAGVGLGPRFNGNSCAQCHAQPATGGSSPVSINPQVALATLDGATNTVYPFIHSPGPVREVRLINNPDGTAEIIFQHRGGRSKSMLFEHVVDPYKRELEEEGRSLQARFPALRTAVSNIRYPSAMAQTDGA